MLLTSLMGLKWSRRNERTLLSFLLFLFIDVSLTSVLRENMQRQNINLSLNDRTHEFRVEPCTFRTLKHNSFIVTTWAGCVDIVTGHLLAGWFIFMGKVIIAFINTLAHVLKRKLIFCEIAKLSIGNCFKTGKFSNQHSISAPVLQTR
jgi:hypothetical protein